MGRGKADSSSEQNLLLGPAVSRPRRKPVKKKVHKQRVVDSKGRVLELGAYAIDRDGDRVLIKDFFTPHKTLVRINVIKPDNSENDSAYAEELVSPPRTFRCHSLSAA